MSRQGHIRIKQATNGELFFVVVAGNYEPLAHSETYTQPKGLINGIEAAIEAAANDRQCIIRYADNANRDPYFKIIAANFKGLLHSETYQEQRKCMHGLQVCRTILTAGRIVDTTGRFPHLPQA